MIPLLLGTAHIDERVPEPLVILILCHEQGTFVTFLRVRRWRYDNSVCRRHRRLVHAPCIDSSFVPDQGQMTSARSDSTCAAVRRHRALRLEAEKRIPWCKYPQNTTMSIITYLALAIYLVLAVGGSSNTRIIVPVFFPLGEASSCIGWDFLDLA